MAIRAGKYSVLSPDLKRPRGPNDKAGEMSEDCLTLKIYRPSNNTQTPRAVMVWIHGGGFTTGGSWMFQGWRLALEGDVIVVTINYRLGIFGFISTGDAAAPGNNGLWDQLMALQWVQDNIEAFGGDKSKVTIFGESAGGASASFLSISPKSKGLFKRSIIQSGNALCSWAFVTESSDAFNAAQTTAKNLNCPDTSTSLAIMDCLFKLSISAESLYNSSLVFIYTEYRGGYTVFEPIKDGDLLPKTPTELLKDTSSEGYRFWNELDVMAGATDSDGAIWIFFYGGVEQGMQTDLANDLMKGMAKIYTTTNEDGLLKVLQNMYLKNNNMDPVQRAVQIANAITDEKFISPTVRLLNHRNGSGKTYMYYFTHAPSIHAIPSNFRPWFNGAAHGDELGFVFGLENFDFAGNGTFTGAEKAFSKTMMKYWSDFAKSGNPSDAWPSYKSGMGYMELDLTPEPKTSLLPERMNFWINTVPSVAKQANDNTKPTSPTSGSAYVTVSLCTVMYGVLNTLF